MEHKFENEILTIYLEGSVDSNNAEDVGSTIESIRNENPTGKLVLDLESLNYISSAGLRQILRLKKKEADLKIINCSSEIYDVFEMTGFSEMMDIEKGYRKFSVDGCEIIGEGSNGIVYRINPDTIVKVYRNCDALEDIKRERELAKTALVLGVNTAIPFDVIKVGDKYASMFELLSAKSITKLIVEDDENKDKYIKIFIDLLKEIHNTNVKPGLLPDSKQRALNWAKDLNGVIDDNRYNKLISLIENVKESNMMVHGDYHTNNVHYDGKEPILIDMDTLSVGNPVFEISNIFLAYQGFGDIDHTVTEKFLKIKWDTATYIWNKCLEYYFEGKDEKQLEDIENRIHVIAYTRLLRRTLRRDKDNKLLIENCKIKLSKAIDEVEGIEL